MSKKILKFTPVGAIGSLFSKKKPDAPTEAAASDSGKPKPIVTPLDPNDPLFRKRGRTRPGLGTSVLGSGTDLSGTLGG